MNLIPEKLKPTPKVAATGGGGLAALILVAIAKQLNIDLGAEEASAFVLVAAWIAGFFKKDKSSPEKKPRLQSDVISGP